MPTEIETRPWGWDPSICPADEHFIEWVRETNPEGNTILHMGTGAHHKVGLDLSDTNSVLGLTLSPKEYAMYIEMCLADPFLSIGYTCVYGDLNRFNFDILGKFNIVTLFHLCEINTDSDHFRALIYLRTHLEKDGYILGYRKSSNAGQAIPLLEEYFKKVGEHKTLDIYKHKEIP